MRGFAITTDAVVAISFFLFAIMIISSQSYQPRAPGGIYLKQLTLDAMTVLEKTGRINQAIAGNNSAIQDIIEATPNLACMDISIMNASGDVVATAVKTDCTENAGLDMQTSARPVLCDGITYVVKSESWFRKEPD
ncbi:hypothetical protein H0O00_05325 [Candidatus Micrarchaeota archaeon]|nr:hypothetical protein [Candidatus Micrarchaeota archaeon]